MLLNFMINEEYILSIMTSDFASRSVVSKNILTLISPKPGGYISPYATYIQHKIKQLLQ